MSTDNTPGLFGPKTDDYPEVMREIAETVATALRDSTNAQAEHAQLAGELAAEAVREKFGGQLMYLPKGTAMQVRRRWQAVWDKFNGSNHEELSREFGLNVKAIYKITAYMRAEMRKRNQRDLFNEPHPEALK
jgi:Mor family transcriptional regulator